MSQILSEPFATSLPPSSPSPPSAAMPAATPSGRPSWSGLLQLNLVGIPLKAYPAVRTREAPCFHQLHADCGQRIRCPKHCPVHGPVDSAAIVRAYEYGPGQHLVLDPDELERLRPAQDRALRLERFLSPGQCDPLLFGGRSLYLLPDGPAAVHAYGVLVAVL
jgi:DNA end-binding protein Ku